MQKFLGKVASISLVAMFLMPCSLVFAEEDRPCPYTPFSIEVGGTGATTLEGAKENLEIPKVVQTAGQGENVVMSQKAVTDAIAAGSGGGIVVTQSAGSSATSVMSQNATTNAINNAKTPIVQTIGQDENVVMSQKAVTDAILTAQTVFNMIYPVGSIYLSVNNVNPMMLFGGEWANWSSGRVPVGVDTSQTEFNAVEKTGGTKTHTLNINEMPGHTHTIKAGYGDIDTSLPDSYRFQRWGGSGNGWKNGDLGAGSAGGGQPHNNLQPYITCYMWKRIA